MAYKRKYTAGSSRSAKRARTSVRSRRRWTGAGNRANYSRVLRTNQQPIFRFSRTADYGYVDIHATDPKLGALSFKLADVTNPSEITSFFDEYRIALIKVTFIPNVPIPLYEGNAATAVALAPNLVTVIDTDDATTPTLTQLQQFDSYKQHGNCAYGKWTRMFIPEVASSVLAGSGVVSGLAQQNQWIDSSFDSILHYGLKYGIQGQGVNAPAGTAVKVEATLYIEARRTI